VHEASESSPQRLIFEALIHSFPVETSMVCHYS